MKKMIETLAQFFGIIGLDMAPPQTLGELIPYLLQVFLAFALLAAIFRLFRSIVMALVTRNPRL